MGPTVRNVLKLRKESFRKGLCGKNGVGDCGADRSCRGDEIQPFKSTIFFLSLHTNTDPVWATCLIELSCKSHWKVNTNI
ncbi:hypothetical protein C0J52_13219 [Blattella germanica]|nr:hypothetical protein C0J52_13219 [Blattella germanica]